MTLRRSNHAYPTVPKTLATLAIGLVVTVPALAGEADIVDATITALGDNRFSVTATVRHADTGWDHYADAFDVVAPDGTVLGVRELLHPHVEEQPFTRSLSSVTIPEGLTHVTIRAHDNVHGHGGATIELAVPGR